MIPKFRQQGMTGVRKDEPKGLLYNRFYSIFLIYTESSISLWNGFTGFKMVELILQYDKSAIKISSVAPSKCFFNSISGYLVASESGLYYFDIVDEANILALPQNRMIKVSKLLAEINISVIKVSNALEPQIQLDRGLQTGYLRCSSPQSKPAS